MDPDYLENCKNGNHTLITIETIANAIDDKVIRWCRICGAIVVDNDFDGRTNPGFYMKMVLPEIAKNE